MKKYRKEFSLSILALAALAATTPVRADHIITTLSGQSFYCEGGNESAGNDYFFRTGTEMIERIDYRFPTQEVVFKLDGANKGSLTDLWSYETLSDTTSGKISLYERVSLRSSVENRHIYRTYEIQERAGEIIMVLYNGVKGARDWTQKTTRTCGQKINGKIVSQGRRYWSTTFSR